MISIRRLLFAFTAVALVGCAVDSSADDSADDEDEIQAGALNEHPSPRVTGYIEPTLSADEKAQVLARYSKIDKTHVAPQALVEKALIFYDSNLAKIANKDWLVVVDLAKHSKEERFFVIDMKLGTVEPHVVAHGKGSDTKDTGLATVFSNVYDSNQSSLGFYLTAETYVGKHGRSLKMDGLSETNFLVRDRDIVIHGAEYVLKGKAKQGRSQGCFALPQKEKDKVIDKLIGGAIIYAAAPKND